MSVHGRHARDRRAGIKIRSAVTAERERGTSAVFGTTSARRVISMRPAGTPPMLMSKITTGFSPVGAMEIDVLRVHVTKL